MKYTTDEPLRLDLAVNVKLETNVDPVSSRMRKFASRRGRHKRLFTFRSKLCASVEGARLLVDKIYTRP